MSGDAMLSPAITRRLIETYMCSPAPDDGGVPQAFAHLADREIEVLRHLAKRASNAEIGHAPFLAETTVKTHIARVLAKLSVRDRVLAKLGVRDRVQAVVQAYEMGLVRAAGKREG